MNSMTGYGQAFIESPLGLLIFEMKSVNRKFLDIVINVPKEFDFLEIFIRKQIAKHVLRGQVFLEIRIDQKMKTWLTSQKKNLLRQEKQVLEKLAKDLGYEKTVVDFSFLMQRMRDFQAITELPKNFEKIVETGLEKVLKALQIMKDKEGKILATHLVAQLEKVSSKVDYLDQHKERMVTLYEERLKEKLKNFEKNLLDPSLQQRISQEVVIFADRLDVTEEITRLRSHLKQFFSLLSSKKEIAIGRKMDFICQELLREANTLGAKLSDPKLSSDIVELKTLLEQIREQVQNIE